MKDISIKIIPKEQQRLIENAGDYFYDKNGVLQIRVSELGIGKRAWLKERFIIIHEIIEQTLTEYRGIAEEEIQKMSKMGIDFFSDVKS